MYYEYSNPDDKELIDKNMTIVDADIVNNDIIIIEPNEININILIKPLNTSLNISSTISANLPCS